MNKYEILEIIGEGTYGVVVKAINKETSQVVAIKKFKDIAKNFIRRELKMLNSLRSCENVVNLKEAYKRKEKIYFIFEYVDKNLLQLLQENRNGLDLVLTKSIIYQLCKAIEKCHSLNIIHRDIKPENLLIDKNNNLKLCDFGFARENHISPLDEPFTEYVATRWYRSPELILVCPYGKPVDVWAIGCIACECTTSRALFPGKSDIDQLCLILQLVGPLSDNLQNEIRKKPKFSSLKSLKFERKTSLDQRFGSYMDDNLLDFTKKCLEIDPNKRYTIEECLLHSVFEGKPSLNYLKQSKSSISNIKNENDKNDERESKNYFYQTLNSLYQSKDSDLLIYNLLNNNFDIQKTIVPKNEETSHQTENQISFPALSTEQKGQTENKQPEGADRSQNNSRASFLSFYIRNQLNQQQKDADKLFLKPNVKFNEVVTEIPKRSKTLNKTNSYGLKSESDRNHFITSNLSNYNKDGINLNNKLNSIITRSKTLTNDSKQDTSRGQLLFKFEDKKDLKNAKRSTSTLETYKNELGVKQTIRKTSITPTKHLESFSTNPAILKTQLFKTNSIEKKYDPKMRHTPDMEIKSSLKRYNNIISQQRPYHMLNFRNQKFQPNVNSPMESVHKNGQIFESLKILNIRKP